MRRNGSIRDAARRSPGWMVLMWVAASAMAAPPDVPPDWQQKMLRTEVIILVGVVGEFRVGRPERISWDVEFPELLLLKTEFGREALDIVDDQVSDMKSIVDDFEEARRRARMEFRKGGPRENIYLVWRKLSGERDACRERLADILLPPQEERLKQILMRWKIRRLGLRHLLVGPWSKELGLSRAEVVAVMQESEKQAERLREKTKNEHRRVIDAILAELRPATKKRLAKEMEGFVYGAQPCIDLLLYQLAYRQDKEHRALPKEPWAGIRLRASFRIAVDGTWEPRPSFRPLGDLGPALRDLLHQPRAAEAIGLSGAQKDAFALIEQEYQRKKRAAGMRLQNLPQARTEEELAEVQKAVERIRAEHEAIYADLAKMILNMLSDAQRAKLERLSRQSLVLRRGYIAALVDGDMGTAVGITAEEKRRLLKIGKRLHGELVDFSAACEKEAYDAVLGRLALEHRSKVLKWIGEPVGSAPAPVTVLIEDLSGSPSGP